MKDIFILGGPNGAGKTTAARTLLPARLAAQQFVNADEIARGLSPFDVDSAALTAGRIMIERMRALVRSDTSFAFETTCSGQSHVRFLQQCKEAGWRITLIYLWLASPEIAIGRVARRVRSGGHNIPGDVIRRRYKQGIINMREQYLPVADLASIYDASEGLVRIAERSPEEGFVIYDTARWKRIESVSR